jgi:cephalosporin-C deacetylase
MYRQIASAVICLLLATSAWAIPPQWEQWLPELTHQDDFDAFWSTAGYQAALSRVPAVSAAHPFAAFSTGPAQTCRAEMTNCKESTLTVPILHLTDWWADDDLSAPLEGKVSLHMTLLPETSRHDGWDPAGLPDAAACKLRDAVLTARHSLRFLLSQHDVHAPRVGIVGEGFGGAVAIALAALDPDLVAFVAIHQPAPGFHYLIDRTPADAPAVLRPLKRVECSDHYKLLHAITYFDFFNFAPRVTIPTLVTMSINDEVATPEQVLAIYNHLNCDKQLQVTDYADHLGHDDRQDFYNTAYKWLQHLGFAQNPDGLRPDRNIIYRLGG